MARKRLGLLRWNAPAECSSTRSEDPTHSLAAELVEFSKFLVERAIVKNFQEAEKLLCTPMWSLARARSAKTAKQKVAALAEARREFSAARAKFTSAPAPDQKPAGDISLARLTGPVGFETQPLKASSPTPPPPEPADTP